MNKKTILIGSGIIIASIPGIYHLSRIGAKKYIEYHEKKIIDEIHDMALSNPDKTKIMIEMISRMNKFKMNHKKLYTFAYKNSFAWEPSIQPLFSLKHMM